MRVHRETNVFVRLEIDFASEKRARDVRVRSFIFIVVSFVLLCCSVAQSRVGIFIRECTSNFCATKSFL